MKSLLQRFACLTAAIAPVVLSTVVTAAEVEPGFKSLFNGKDLTEWDGNPKLWSVQDGTITGKTGSDADTKINHNTFLVYKGGDVADFELRLSYKIVGGNSGIQYRSKVLETGKFGPIVGGYQADFEAGKTYSGILYEERMRGILAQRGQKTSIQTGLYVTDTKEETDPKTGAKKQVKTRREVQPTSAEAAGAKPDTKVVVTGSVGDTKEIQAKIKDEDWNDYVVIARGNHLQHFINGQQTVDVIDEQEAKAAKSGVLALQIHAGPPMTVQFRNLRIKKLSGDSAKRSDLELMQGKWLPVEIIANGKTLEADVLNAIKVTIHENTYKTERPNGVDEGTFKLDESTTPRTMNLTSDSGKDIPAIYEISDDTFKACYALGNASKPMEFKSAEDSNHILVTYKRKSE
jgi:uncharacterized protein (TIGR03067 family)